MKLLGQGSFGTVWKEENPPGNSGYNTLDKYIAKKVIENPDDNAWAEVQLLQSLHHENIVKCLGSYRSGSSLGYCNNSEATSLTIVLEYCDGGTFADMVRSPCYDRSEGNVWRITR